MLIPVAIPRRCALSARGSTSRLGPVPEQLLIVLKFCLLALVYVFFFRVLRAVWAQLREPELASAATAAPAAAPRAAAAPAPAATKRRSAPAAVSLVVREPKGLAGTTYALTDELTLGRAPGCHITLDDTYANEATALINAIWEHEIDHSRGEMVKAGDAWGDVDITNPSYYAPAYYRVFGKFVGKESDWNKVVDSSYRIIEASLSAERGNATNGLVPAWCNSQGVPTEAYGGAPLHFQNDSTRTPFRVGQDYCYFGEPRAKAYMEKITSFYLQVGVSNIVDGYNLDGSPHPEHSDGTSLPASFVGPAAVGAMYNADNLAFVDEAYSALATLKLDAGTIYYQKSWTALSLLMLNGGFIEL